MLAIEIVTHSYTAPERTAGKTGQNVSHKGTQYSGISLFLERGNMLIFQVIYSYLPTALRNVFENLGIIPMKNRIYILLRFCRMKETFCEKLLIYCPFVVLHLQESFVGSPLTEYYRC